MRHMWNAQAALTGNGAISSNKLPVLAQAVYKKCDGIDGLEHIWSVSTLRKKLLYPKVHCSNVSLKSNTPNSREALPGWAM